MHPRQRILKQTKRALKKTDFADFLRNITEHREHFPQYLDEEQRVVLPKVASDFGIHPDADNIYWIQGEQFTGNYNGTTSIDEINGTRCHFLHCEFNAANFISSRWPNVLLQNIDYTHTNFSGSDLNGATFTLNYNPTYTTWDDCNLTNTNWVATPPASVLYGCKFRRANLSGATLVGLNNGSYIADGFLQECDFSGADLSNVHVDSYHMWGSILNQTNLAYLRVTSSTSDKFFYNGYTTFFNNLIANCNLYGVDLSGGLILQNNRLINSSIVNANLQNVMLVSGRSEVGDDDDVADFYDTQFIKVDATNAILARDSLGQGMDSCNSSLQNYLLAKSAIIGPNCTFGIPDRSFSCSTAFQVAAIGGPIGLLLVSAFLAYLYIKNRHRCHYENISETRSEPTTRVQPLTQTSSNLFSRLAAPFHRSRGTEDDNINSSEMRRPGMSSYSSIT